MAEKHVVSQQHQMFIDERDALFESFGQDSYELKKKLDDDFAALVEKYKAWLPRKDDQQNIDQS